MYMKMLTIVVVLYHVLLLNLLKFKTQVTLQLLGKELAMTHISAIIYN